MFIRITRSLECLTFFLSLTQSVSAQDHLSPDASAFVDPGSYLLKARHVFIEAFEEEVTLRCLVLPSFHDEYVVGLSIKEDKVEAFVLEPSSNIWMSENLERCQNSIKAYEEDGEKVPIERIERLKDLKASGAVDYRTIKANRRALPLPRELAGEIKTVWETMLLDVRHPQKLLARSTDGVIYHYSTWIDRRGEISGHVHQPKYGSKTGELTSLALVLGDYARGKKDLDTLKKKLDETRLAVKR